MNKILKSPVGAVASKGFLKAFLYSFGSFFVGWGIIYLASPEAAMVFGQKAWLLPTINSLLVFAKQTLDTYKTKI